MPDVADLCRELGREQTDLDRFVASRPARDWSVMTPAPGWTVHHQIAHLEFFDRAAVRAATEPESFERDRVAFDRDADTYQRNAVVAGLAATPSVLLDRWRRQRVRFRQVFEQLDPSMRVPWYGPPMKVASKITARLMETWAHGQDVMDALGGTRAQSARLRHVAHIGVLARPYSFAMHQLPAPDEDVFVDLVGPDDERWTWGPDAAVNTVTGTALDFCLVVTRRRHVADTGLVATGPVATAWVEIAQSFAGDPGHGRTPGQFPRDDVRPTPR